MDKTAKTEAVVPRTLPRGFLTPADLTEAIVRIWLEAQEMITD